MRGSAANFIPRRERLIAYAAVAVGVACIIGWLLAIAQVAKVPGDTQEYIRAALRLNAGQSPYGYSLAGTPVSSDAVGDYLSPPLLAVVFRTLVLLPANGQYVWWAAMVLLETSAVIALIRRAPLVTGLAMVPLSLAIGMAMWQGNVDCLVVGGLVVSWYLLVQRHDGFAAALICLLASLKLMPLIFVWWLFVTGRLRAAAIAIGCGIVLALVAAVGSEPLIFSKFYQFTAVNLSAPSSVFGPSGLAYAVGLPEFVITWLPRVLLFAGAAAMWKWRRRPGLSWAIGAVLMWLASPVASLHTPALLLVALAPVAWSMRYAYADPSVGAVACGPEQSATARPTIGVETAGRSV